MADNKKSFIAYSDWKDTFDALPNDKAGLLIKHIFAYVNDENPKTEDTLINAVFANIKNTLKRDLKKWDKQYKQRVDAGKKSAEVRKRNSTVVNERSISSTVSVSDSVNVNVINNYIDEVSKSEDYLNNFYRMYGLEHGSAVKLLELFKQHLIMNDKQHENYSQFKKHFNNWMNTKNSNGGLDKYKLQRRGAL